MPIVQCAACCYQGRQLDRHPAGYQSWHLAGGFSRGLFGCQSYPAGASLDLQDTLNRTAFRPATRKLAEAYTAIAGSFPASTPRIITCLPIARAVDRA